MTWTITLKQLIKEEHIVANNIRFYRKSIREIKDEYSGKIILRIDPETHKKLAYKSIENDVSLNLLLNIILEEWLRKEDK